MKPGIIQHLSLGYLSLMLRAYGRVNSTDPRVNPQEIEVLFHIMNGVLDEKRVGSYHNQFIKVKNNVLNAFELLIENRKYRNHVTELDNLRRQIYDSNTIEEILNCISTANVLLKSIKK